MFDVGDSFYTLGTTYAIGKMRLNGGSKDKNENYVLTILKGLLTSVPFDTYMIMTILSFLNCRLPDFITMAADFCGKGNGFLTMIMIGVSLELHMSREAAKEVITLLSMRYVIGIIAAVLIYCVLPAPLVMRQILAAAMFASSAAVSIIYIQPQPRLATPLVWAVPRSLATTRGIINLFFLPANSEVLRYSKPMAESSKVNLHP